MALWAFSFSFQKDMKTMDDACSDFQIDQGTVSLSESCMDPSLCVYEVQPTHWIKKSWDQPWLKTILLLPESDNNKAFVENWIFSETPISASLLLPRAMYILSAQHENNFLNFFLFYFICQLAFTVLSALLRSAMEAQV